MWYVNFKILQINIIRSIKRKCNGRSRQCKKMFHVFVFFKNWEKTSTKEYYLIFFIVLFFRIWLSLHPPFSFLLLLLCIHSPTLRQNIFLGISKLYIARFYMPRFFFHILGQTLRACIQTIGPSGLTSTFCICFKKL